MRKKYDLKNLCCANCANKIEENVNDLEGVKKAQVNFLMKKLIIEASESELSRILDESEIVIKRIEPDVVLVR